MFSIPSLRGLMNNNPSGLNVAFNGTVEDIAQDADAIYLVGSFTKAVNISAFNAKGSAKINNIDASLIDNLHVEGFVNCYAIYGNALYIAGNFIRVKNISRWMLVKVDLTTLDVDTTFDTSNGFDSSITSIAIDSSGNVYVGGAFTTYKGAAAQCIAKLNGTTGVLDTTFDTSTGFNNSVLTLVCDPSDNLYVGGYFTTYKGTTRQLIAKLNGTNAALDTTFDAASGFTGTSSYVRKIIRDSSNNLYVVGQFSSYKSTTRQNIAKIDGTNASLNTTFDSASGFFGAVEDLILDSSNKLYVVGAFTAYKSINRQYIAKIDGTTAALDTTFDTVSGFNTSAFTVTRDASNNLYVGGAFVSYKGTAAQYIAKLNPTTGALDTTFNTTIGANDFIYSVFLDPSNNLYIGGRLRYYKLTETSVQYFAKILKSTGELDPNFDTTSGFDLTTYSIAVDSSGIYVGGLFTTYKGTTRQRIAKIDKATAALDTTFDTASGFNSTVRKIIIGPLNKLYVGGGFTTYKGSNFYGILCRIDKTTAAADSTFAYTGLNGEAFDIVLTASNELYVAGSLSTTSNYRNIMKIDTNGALITAFNTINAFNSVVYGIALDSSGNLYAVGGFTDYKGTARQRIVKLNGTTAALDTTFDSSSGFSATATAITIDSNNNIYVGGLFLAYKNVSRNRIVKLENINANADSNFIVGGSGFNNTVNRIVIDSTNNLYVGGAFQTYITRTSSLYLHHIRSDTGATIR